ncbi:MAG: amidohydrolase family protein [Acidimicrobiales bacterium]
MTAGLVCAHHHLYSALARGMPAPPATPTDFLSILQQIWWRLDAALDLDLIEWSAKLGALEALECGTTAIIDHHESPNAIEGSLDVIAAACAEVGVRALLCYGVTDRWRDDGRLDLDAIRNGTALMTDGARRGLAENERYLRAGGRGHVGVHAAFTCTDATLEAAAGLAAELGTGVHVHLHEGPDDAGAADRLAPLSTDRWLLAHAVHLPDGHPIRGTITHQPRSNLNNAVGYTRPARFAGAPRWCSAPTASAPTCSRSSASPTWCTAATTSPPGPTRPGAGCRPGPSSWPRWPATASRGATHRWNRGTWRSPPAYGPGGWRSTRPSCSRTVGPAGRRRGDQGQGGRGRRPAVRPPLTGGSR